MHPTVPTLPAERPLREALAFVALTFALALTGYLPLIAADRGLVGVAVPGALAYLGAFSPALAALVLRTRREGRAGVRAVLAGLLDRRFGRRWWAVTLGLPVVTFAVLYGAFLGLGGPFEVSERVAMLQAAGPTVVFVVPVMALVIVLVSFGEEAGWRGYLLPLLQARMGALAASLLLGVVWFAWHVPLLYLPGSANAAFPVGLWAVSIVASAVAYTWLFNNTGGSVLAVTLLHAGYNFWGPLVALHPAETGSTLSAWLITGGDVVLAVALVALFGAGTPTAWRSRRGVGESVAEQTP